MGDDADNIKAIAQGSTQGAVEGAMKPFSDLLQALLGPSAEEGGLLLRDLCDGVPPRKTGTVARSTSQSSWPELELTFQRFP